MWMWNIYNHLQFSTQKTMTFFKSNNAIIYTIAQYNPACMPRCALRPCHVNSPATWWLLPTVIMALSCIFSVQPKLTCCSLQHLLLCIFYKGAKEGRGDCHKWWHGECIIIWQHSDYRQRAYLARYLHILGIFTNSTAFLLTFVSATGSDI